MVDAYSRNKILKVILFIKTQNLNKIRRQNLNFFNNNIRLFVVILALRLLEFGQETPQIDDERTFWCDAHLHFPLKDLCLQKVSSLEFH
jgi:hypothetical protein